jgi:hypothetical protein
MSDIAMMGIGVDSSGVKAANDELGKMPAKGAAAEAATNKLAKSTDMLTRLYKDLAKAMAAWKVLDMIRDATMLAARYETMGVVMGVAGNNAGYTRREMAALEKQLQSTGISMLGARNALTSLATAGIDLTKAKTLARMSQDLAVVAGINSSDALQRMVHGIKSGETEVLKTMGLNVSFENSYKRLAAQLGINKDALTEQQKVQARTNAVMQEATKYAGIYEESMTTAGKAITSLSRYWEDFQVKAGAAFLPALADGVFRLTDALKAANAELDKAGSEGTIDRIGRGLSGAFKAVYETVVVFGANVAYVLGAVGNEIGGILAQIAAGARDIANMDWNFTQFNAVRDAMVSDAEAGRKAVDAFSDAMLKGASASQVAAAASQGDASAKEQQRMAAGAASRAAEAAEEKRLKAAEEAAKANKKAAADAETRRKHAVEFIASLQQERLEIGATEQQIKMLAAAKEAAKAPTAALRLQIMETALALTVEAKAYADAEAMKATLKAANDAHVKSMADELQGVNDLVAAAKLEVETYGMLAPAITRATVARLEAKRAALDGVEGTELEVSQIEALIRANEKLLGFQQQKQALDEMFDPGAVESFGEALKKAFAGAGDAMAGLGNALGDYMKMQEDADRDRKKATLAHQGDAVALGKALEKINNKERKDSMAAYADMAGAGKKFFKEHTAGYKVLDAVEKAFHAWKMVTMVTEFATKTGFITAETAAVITGNTTKTASAVSGAAVEVGAKMATAQAGAVAAVANQGGGDPYTAFFRIAAMAAIMAGLGLAVGGGGGGGGGIPISKQRQDANGTGSVLGDSSAKSESLTNALDYLASNSSIELEHSSRMLAELRGIHAGISGMASFVARSSGLRGTPADMAALGVGSSKGALGFSSSSTELRDQGLYFPGMPTGPGSVEEMFGWAGQGDMDAQWSRLGSRNVAAPTTPQTIGGILGGGINAGSYADVHKEKSSWWGLSKSSSDETKLGEVGDELKRQLTLTVGSMYNAVLDAADVLGKGGSTLEAALQSVALPFERISLMGLKGDEIEAEIQAAFSQLGDAMAQQVAADLAPFQKVGEGMFETLIRVANGVEVATFELEQFGIASIGYGDLLNKQGDVAAELVRESILAAESMAGVAGIMATLDGTASDLAETYGRLKDIQQALVAVGEDPAALNRTMVRGARGLDSLETGLSTYLNAMFTDGEKAAATAAAMSAQFERIGLVMPATNEGLRVMASGLLDGTEAGALLFGQVMALVPQFVDMTDAAKDLAEGYRDHVREALDLVNELQDGINDLRGKARQNLADAVAAVQSNLATLKAANVTAQANLATARASMSSALQGVAQSIAQASAAVLSAQEQVANARAGITAGYLNALNAEASARDRLAQAQAAHVEAMRSAGDDILAMLRELAGMGSVRKAAAVQRAEFEAMAGRAMAGDLEAAQGIAGAGKSFLDASGSSSRSAEDFNADKIRVQQVLAQVVGRTGSGAGQSGQGDPLAAAQSALAQASAEVARWLKAVEASGASKEAEQTDLLAAYNTAVFNLATAQDSQARLYEAVSVAGLDLTNIQANTDAWNGSVTTAVKARDALNLAETTATTAAADLALGLLLANAAGVTLAAVKTPAEQLIESLGKLTEAQATVTAIHAELYNAESSIIVQYRSQAAELYAATNALAVFRTSLAAVAPTDPLLTATEVPHYADGTNNHPGGWAMVGEDGAEAVYLPGGSQVRTAGQTRAMRGDGDGEVGPDPLVVEMQEFRREQRSIGVELIKSSKANEKRWKKFDITGLPPTRT